MVGDDTHDLDQNQSLVLQRHVYQSLPPAVDNAVMRRFMHRNYTNIYEVGRHSVTVPFTLDPGGVIFKYYWTPWPELLERKHQIGQRLPPPWRGRVPHHCQTCAALQTSAREIHARVHLNQDAFVIPAFPASTTATADMQLATILAHYSSTQHPVFRLCGQQGGPGKLN